MEIFRENTEDIYASIEWQAGSKEANDVLHFIQTTYPKVFEKIRFGTAAKTKEWHTMLGSTNGKVNLDEGQVAIGIKPVSRDGSERLVRAAVDYAIKNKRKSVTLVHKGNIMKFTEGGFRDWGYQVAEREFGDKTYTWNTWEET